VGRASGPDKHTRYSDLPRARAAGVRDSFLELHS
jgi:hypothetical protein